MLLKQKVIVDTGFMVALFHENDKQHQAAVELENKLGDSYQFVSTVFVIQEICWLLLKRVGHHKVLEFMDIVSDELILLPTLPDKWIENTTAILRKYSDKNLDLADASLVVLADHLNLGDIISIDIQDFTVLRWSKGKKHSNNLMHQS
jgi:uncharacterized protein